MSRRDEIIRARKLEKLKWLCLDSIADIRKQNGLQPFHMQDPAIDSAATSVIAQAYDQIINSSLPQQVNMLVPYINQAIAEIAGDVVNGGSLTDTDQQAYDRMMGDKESAARSAMPYNSGAKDGDPYAALLLHQVKEADKREIKLAAEKAERRKKQSAFLNEQIVLKKRLEEEAKVKQLRLDLIEKEKQNEWTRLENAKNQEKEMARRAEYQRIMEFSVQRNKQLENERDAVRLQDQQFLQQIADAQIAADHREKEIDIKWKEEARLTKESNDERLGIRVQAAQREMEEDKERIRLLMEVQKKDDERRKADLESMKRHQDVLTGLGEKAAQDREAFEARIEEQIQAAILIDQEKVRKKEQAKQDAKTKFLQEQALWRDSEKQRKLESIQLAKREEYEEVARFKQKVIDDYELDLKKAEEKRRQAQEVNAQLRQQMIARQERDRAAKVHMSPAELAMNAGVLSQFSPVRRPEKSTMQRTGQSIIF